MMKLKLKIFFILLNFCLQLNGQTIRRIDFVANDIVYAPQHNSIYATAPSANKSFGNTVCRIDPTTGAVKQSVYIGTEPTFMAVSDNGQYLYVGLEYIPRIIRLKLPELKPDLTILMTDTSATNQGVIFVEDIKVLPGKPTSIAVVQGAYAVPSFTSLAIYDEAKVRPKIGDIRSASLYGLANITFLGNNSDTLLGGDHNYSHFIPIDTEGVGTLSKNYGDKILGFDRFLKYSKRDNLIYTGSKVINPRSNPPLTILHTFDFQQDNSTSGLRSAKIVEPDPFSDALFMSYLVGGKLLLKKINTQTRFVTNEWTLMRTPDERTKQVVNLGQPEKMAILSDNNIFLFDNGCVSDISVAPIINQGNAFTLCKDSTVLLSVNTNNRILWSTGDTTTSIRVKNADSYSAAFLDSKGCAGPSSSPMVVTEARTAYPPSLYSFFLNGSMLNDVTICKGDSLLVEAQVFSGFNLSWNTGETSPTIKIMKPGQYFAISTNSEGCKAYSPTISVQYKALPIPPRPIIKIVGKTDLCSSNEKVMLQAPSGYKAYSWTNRAKTDTITVSTTNIDSFAVKVFNTEGCASEQSDFIKIRQLSIPTKPLLIYKDSLLQSTNTASYNHRWFLNGELIPNVNTPNYKPLSAGFYTVQAYISSCDSPFSDWSNILLPLKTNIESIVESSFIQVYPNPVNDVLRIQIVSEIKGGTIELYDNTGKMMKQEKITASDNQIEMSVSSLQNGTYTLIWKSQDGVIRKLKKIIKTQ
jgi:Secretion system C-terminal sorting domain